MNTEKSAAVRMVLSSSFEVVALRGALVEVVSGPCINGLVTVRAIGRTAPRFANADGSFEISQEEVRAYV